MPPPVSADAHPDAVGIFAGLQRQRAAVRHRLHRVFDEVHQNLLHLRRVQRRRRQVARQFRFHGQAAIFKFRPQQFQGFFHNVIERSQLQLRRRGPDRLEKLRDDVIQPVDFAFGHVEILFEPVGDFRRVRFGDQSCDANAKPVLICRARAFSFFNSRSMSCRWMCSAFSGLPISCATLAASKVKAWHAFAFDGFKSFLPRLGRVVQDQRDAGTALASPSSGAA